jgi:hypothetical protein
MLNSEIRSSVVLIMTSGKRICEAYPFSGWITRRHIKIAICGKMPWKQLLVQLFEAPTDDMSYEAKRHK